jgi:hypothetical protein
MTRHHTKVKPSPPERSSGRRVTAMGIMFAAVSVVPAIWLGPPVAATSTLGPLKPVGCAPMTSDPPLRSAGRSQLQVGRVVVPATARHPGARRFTPAAP